MYLLDFVANILGVIFVIWFFSLTLKAAINSRGFKKAFLVFFCAYIFAASVAISDPYLYFGIFVAVFFAFKDRFYWVVASFQALLEFIRPNRFRKAYEQASESADYWKNEYQREANNSRHYKNAYEDEKYSKHRQEEEFRRERNSHQKQKQERPPEEEKMTFHKALALFKLSVPYTQREVKKAFKVYATKYHTDKVSDLPPEFQKLANQKMAEAENAREILLSRL